MMSDGEKRRWIEFLHHVADDGFADDAVDPANRQWLGMVERLLKEMADDLELEWFPRRRQGRRSRSEWTYKRTSLHNLRSEQIRRQVDAEFNRMKKRGETPRCGTREDAIAKVAERRGLQSGGLKKQMKLLPRRHP
jgi:hypothetical protein